MQWALTLTAARESIVWCGALWQSVSIQVRTGEWVTEWVSDAHLSIGCRPAGAYTWPLKNAVTENAGLENAGPDSKGEKRKTIVYGTLSIGHPRTWFSYVTLSIRYVTLSVPTFSSPAFSTPAIWSPVFPSRVFGVPADTSPACLPSHCLRRVRPSVTLRRPQSTAHPLI